MRLIRKIRPFEENNFALNRASFLISRFENIFKIVNTTGLIIGCFSIIVGILGVANIMFVPVKEKTKLIDIQKAIGAGNYFILLQYLLESIILSLMGGLICLFFVIIGVFYLNKYSEIEVTLYFNNIVFLVILSIIIGVIAGFLPVYKASKMNPIEAFNSVA
ncbi:MAG: FtsX-like permease family protein [Bacteroidales bacterium]|nr:FtsX-like permease family protein [Bacteroidales bacterium]